MESTPSYKYKVISYQVRSEPIRYGKIESEEMRT
jgi:hypothetical protein